MIHGGLSFAYKADGILLNFHCKGQEFLLFENVGPPNQSNVSKFRDDIDKCLQHCMDAICKTFWDGSGNAFLASKYYVLAYIVYHKLLLFLLLHSLYLHY